MSSQVAPSQLYMAEVTVRSAAVSTALSYGTVAVSSESAQQQPQGSSTSINSRAQIRARALQAFCQTKLQMEKNSRILITPATLASASYSFS